MCFAALEIKISFLFVCSFWCEGKIENKTISERKQENGHGTFVSICSLPLPRFSLSFFLRTDANPQESDEKTRGPRKLLKTGWAKPLKLSL